jgi:hypothetical protein
LDLKKAAEFQRLFCFGWTARSALANLTIGFEQKIYVNGSDALSPIYLAGPPYLHLP